MIKMIKTVHRNMTGVSNMADQGRIILQLYSVCNLSIEQKKALITAQLICAFDQQVFSRRGSFCLLKIAKPDKSFILKFSEYH